MDLNGRHDLTYKLWKGGVQAIPPTLKKKDEQKEKNNCKGERSKEKQEGRKDKGKKERTNEGKKDRRKSSERQKERPEERQQESNMFSLLSSP